MSLLKFLGLTAAGGLGAAGLGTQRGRDFLFGSDKFREHDAYSPEQQGLFQEMGGQLGQSGGYGQSLQNLMQLLDPSSESYDRFTQPYMDQFQNEIIPGLAERFAGRGALGSSGFGQSLSSAGAGLTNTLAQLKAGLQQQAGDKIMGQYQNYLGNKPKYTQFVQNQGLLQGIAPAAAKAYLGGG